MRIEYYWGPVAAPGPGVRSPATPPWMLHARSHLRDHMVFVPVAGFALIFRPVSVQGGLGVSLSLSFSPFVEFVSCQSFQFCLHWIALFWFCPPLGLP